MASPGEKQGTCGYIMASFDSHLNCAHCCNKGVGEDMCVLKKDCSIASHLLSSRSSSWPHPRTMYEKKEHSEKTATPTQIDPADCKLLGKVEGDRVIEETPPSKQKKSYSDNTPKASKKKAGKSA